jgi:hypothetical protein
MKQRGVIKFYFKSGKTPTEVYSDLKNVYGDERVVQSTDASHGFKMAGNRWRMNLVEAGHFPLGPMKKWRTLTPVR